MDVARVQVRYLAECGCGRASESSKSVPRANHEMAARPGHGDDLQSRCQLADFRRQVRHCSGLADLMAGDHRLLLAEGLVMANVWERLRVGLDAAVAMKHSASGMVRYRVRRPAHSSSQS